MTPAKTTTIDTQRKAYAKLLHKKIILDGQNKAHDLTCPFCEKDTIDLFPGKKNGNLLWHCRTCRLPFNTVEALRNNLNPETSASYKKRQYTNTPSVYHKWLLHAALDTTLSHAADRLLQILVSMANYRTQTVNNISISLLAIKMNQSLRSVRRDIKELEAHRYITVTRSKPTKDMIDQTIKQEINSYLLHVEMIKDASKKEELLDEDNPFNNPFD